MISRQWRGLAKRECAASYVEHLRTETFPAIGRIAGFLGASILRRPTDSGVEFLIVTRWASMGAIREFAGATAESAVVPANVQEMMIEYDHFVRHYDVLE